MRNPNLKPSLLSAGRTPALLSVGVVFSSDSAYLDRADTTSLLTSAAGTLQSAAAPVPPISLLRAV